MDIFKYEYKYLLLIPFVALLPLLLSIQPSEAMMKAEKVDSLIMDALNYKLDDLQVQENPEVPQVSNSVNDYAKVQTLTDEAKKAEEEKGKRGSANAGDKENSAENEAEQGNYFVQYYQSILSILSISIFLVYLFLSTLYSFILDIYLCGSCLHLFISSLLYYGKYIGPTSYRFMLKKKEVEIL